MINARDPSILPYSYVVGQEQLKLALELAFIAPRIGGVLLSGQRGTAKSTAVRAFSLMAYGELPVTLPINATDDRVLGGWQLDALMEGKTEPQPGLLEEASDKGLLYVDEVNLLDDHIVNIILDAVSTGLLIVQREAIDKVIQVRFSLVGTMNPEEGGLRPQLLDRFGLMVNVSELESALRGDMLSAVLRFDEELDLQASPWIAEGRKADQKRRKQLEQVRKDLRSVQLSPEIAQLCADVAAEFKAVGHRGEVVTALAARAKAALDGSDSVEAKHVAEVAPMALQHRRPELAHGSRAEWSKEDAEFLVSLVTPFQAAGY
jgi:magnesium chelatase subunit I